MLYTSTRDNNVRVESAQAIAQGISEDGGLFVPVSVPKLSEESILSLVNADYITRAAEILSMYLSDFSKEELYRYAQGAYWKSQVWRRQCCTAGGNRGQPPHA